MCTIEMPRLKEPLSLKDLVLRRISELVQGSAIKIIKSVRKTPMHVKDQLVTDTTKLRKHLKSSVHLLPNHVSTYTSTQDGMLCVFETKSACTNGGTMTSLIYRADSDPNGQFWSFCHGISDLVKLELTPPYMEIPEEIMETISEMCLKLEVIQFNFRSTTLQGFSQLKAIKSLRIIKDTHSQEFFQEENESHVELLNILLRELPKLEFITCHCVGDILVGLRDVQSLSLKQICIRKPTDAKIDAVIRLCPNLESLNLVINQDPLTKLLFPFSFLDSYFFSYFTTLTNSPLQIRFLELYCTGIKFIKQIEDFIVIKGIFLKNLIVTSFDDITIEEVKVIGRNCPFIEELEISDSGNFLNRYIPCETNERIFENLVKFITNVTGLLLPCLAHAEEIRTVYLGRQRNPTSDAEGNEIEKAFTELITLNTMSELNTLVIDRFGFEFSLHLVQYFYNRPKLDCLFLEHVKGTPELIEYLENLNEETDDDSGMVLHWDV